jgi:hypothetical protein
MAFSASGQLPLPMTMSGAAAAPAPAIASDSASYVQPGPTASHPTQSADVVPVSDPELLRLKGVSGWLMFFCIAMMVLRPIMTISAMQKGTNIVFALKNCMLMLFSITTGFMILTVKPSALTWLKWFFAVYAVLIVLEFALFLSLGLTAAGWLLLMRGIVFLTVWVVYFQVSRRVRATFGRNLFGKQTA